MIRRLFNECLLRPEDFSPSQDDLVVIGAFNPGAAAIGDEVILLVRVAETLKEKRNGFLGLPRWDEATNRIIADWVGDTDANPVDVRVCRHKKSGLMRLNFISRLQVVRSRDGRHIDEISEVCFGPENKYEEFGIEDPRITKIGDTFWITYVAVSRHGATTALASTKDFKSFERHGIIFCTENKDVVLFPEKIGGEFFALHRPNGATPFTKPEIWLARSPDLIHWGKHEQFLGGDEEWDIGRIGAGTPPIRTEQGWLEFYHGNSRREEERSIGIYSGGALLLDADEPRQILGRAGRVFVPEKDFEVNGFVPNVVFPTGIVQQDESLLVYYGAADTFTGVVEFSLKELLKSLSKGEAARKAA